MKTSNWKFFAGIGVLLLIAGVIIFPNDGIIGVIGILFGIYNLIKGIRLKQGIQPLLIRKQKEKQQEIKDEVKDKMTQSKNQKKND